MDNLTIPPSEPALREYLEALRSVVQNDDVKFLDRLITQVKLLSSQAQKAAWEILRQWRDQGKSSVLRNIWQIDFEREPVSISQFIEDDYYLGKICNPKDEDQGRLYDVWKEDLMYVCDPRSGIIEWALTGAIGTGKTTAGVLGMIYKGPYMLSCMRDPSRFFGLMSKSKIVFGIYATTVSKVSAVDFAEFLAKIDASPYFREVFPRVPNLSTMAKWPQKNMHVSFGSRELHALGENLYSFLMDEVNFMERPKGKNPEDNPEQAYKLFHACRTRIESRFARRGIIPGLMVLISSRNTKTDFLERRLEMVQGRKDVHISDYSPWDVRKSFGDKFYSGKKFSLSLGNKYVRPKILEEGDATPAGVETIEVPIEHKQAFIDDINQALRDVAGVATFGRNLLIHDPQRVMKVINWGRAHPFSAESISVTLDDQVEISDFVDWDSLVRIRDSSYVPRIDPGAPRTVHVDQATSNDSLGIALGHVQDFILVRREDPLSGHVMNSYEPKIFIDMMMKITPGKDSEVDLTKVITFLLNLRNYGYNLNLITYDGWQSKIALQQFQRLHYNAKIQSVDRTDDAYIALRTAIYEDRLDIYDYAPFFDEITNVIHIIRRREGDPQRRGKVDHGPNGSKDVSDAVAGVTMNCYEIAEAPAVTPEQAAALAATIAPPAKNRDSWVLQDYKKGRIIGVQ